MLGRNLFFLAVIVAGLSAMGHAAELGMLDPEWERKRAVQRERDATALNGLLGGVKEIEVMTIEPRSEMDDEQKAKVDSQSRLDWWMPVLKVRVTDPKQIAQLRDGLLRSIDTSTGSVAPCFRPRHGMRFHKDGVEIALIVCFECTAMEIHRGRSMEGVSISPAAVQDFYLVFRAHGLTKPSRLGNASDAAIAARLVGRWGSMSRTPHGENLDILWDMTETFESNGTYHSETKLSFVGANKEPEQWKTELDHGTWRIERGMLWMTGAEPDRILTRLAYERLAPLIEVSETQICYGSLQPGSEEEKVWIRK